MAGMASTRQTSYGMKATITHSKQTENDPFELAGEEERALGSRSWR